MKGSITLPLRSAAPAINTTLPVALEVLSVVNLSHAVRTIYSKSVRSNQVPEALSFVTLSLEVEPIVSRERIQAPAVAMAVPAESSTHWRDSVVSRLAAPSNKRSREEEIPQAGLKKVTSMLL